jgi:hypothetical protein
VELDLIAVSTIHFLFPIDEESSSWTGTVHVVLDLTFVGGE